MRERGGSKRTRTQPPRPPPQPTPTTPPKTERSMFRIAMICSLALAILPAQSLVAQTKSTKGFANAKGSNPEKTAELKLVGVRFEKRKFELSFKNVGTAATRPETLVLVLRNIR